MPLDWFYDTTRKGCLSIGKTSYEVKKRYENKVYTMIAARIPKDLAEQFRTVTAQKGDSQAAIIKDAIEKYLDENK